ncbi:MULTISPECIES: hypothetical protein [unclassified Streptomyces]|uniref:hypothetical protein n=1 Tax=unclassified Streptomyces TaxID=2593676 RepID=UPI00166127A1|nr:MULTISPECIES: hypothetical protein [unclassified Streptomyces]
MTHCKHLLRRHRASDGEHCGGGAQRPCPASDIADRALKDQMAHCGFLAELLIAECDDR